jgi:AcrR family transcriptional regulator
MPQLTQSTSDSPRPRRVGRPRAQPRTSDGETREELLDAAAELFSQVGYSGATTREIARAVGIRQPTLFHYFSSKRDLFAELLDRTVQPGLEILAELHELQPPPDVSVYVLAYCDTYNLCAGRYNVPILQLLPDAGRSAFVEFWNKRERLIAGYLDLVAAGQAAGLMRVDDPERTGLVICGTVESVRIWFDRSRQQPEEVARAVAELICGGLVGLSRLSTVRRTADRLIPQVTAGAARSAQGNASGD